MRVLVVTVVHTPLDARIHHRQIRAMRAAGWQVSYAAPWRATDPDLAAVVEGVVRIEVPRAHGRHRLAGLRGARRVLATAGPDHDLIVLHDPELVLALAGLRQLPPVVLDVHEDLAASLVDRSWVPAPLRGPAARGAGWLEAAAQRRCRLLLAEPGYAARFARPHPVVRNLPPLPASPARPGTDRVVYVGRLSTGRGVHELVALGRELRADGIRVELIGTADAEVAGTLQAAAEAGEVVWHGFLPNDRALAQLDGALAGVSLLHDLPNYRRSMPTKVVEYLAAGLPAITTPLPEAVRLVAAARAGVVVPFGDVPATAAAVRTLRDDPAAARAMGDRGRAVVADGYSWDAEQHLLLAALEAAAHGAPRPALSPLPADVRVAVVVPARQAAATLGDAVAAALQPPVDELAIAVGPSTDGTEALAAELAAADPRVVVVANPSGRTPDALNLAVAATTGQVVVRVDAHAVLPPGYVARAVATLAATGAANVGGRQVPTADHGFARAVAAAMRSPLGAGGATYRVGGRPGPVDTVYLGAFHRDALDAVGGFDPVATRNQDAELNLRLTAAGHQVWFDPQLAVAYRPRDRVRRLAAQYHGYGRWRRRTARLHPGSLAPRQLAAPAVVVGLAAAAAASLVGRDVRPLALVAGGYGTALAAAGWHAADRRADGPAVAVALATMHLAWGVGFLQGPPRSAPPPTEPAPPPPPPSEPSSRPHD